MNKLSSILLACLLMGNTACAAAPNSNNAAQHSTQSSINWYTNYDEAVEVAKAKGVPLILFFTGSDWCTWCTKLEKEALDTKDFARLAGDKFIFVKLDFPNHPIDPKLQSQNKQLKKKYSITGFPSLVIVDPAGQRIGADGYRPGGGTAYAEHLLSMAASYQKHQATLQELGSQKTGQATTFNDLKDLYLKAMEEGQTQQAAALVEKGIKVDKDNFFLLAQYRAQIDDGNLNTKEAIQARTKLLNVPTTMAMSANRDVAIVEFQVLQKNMQKQKLTPAAVVTPLIHYIEKFGAKDPDIWRVKMTIAQVYLEAGQPKEALRYAREAEESATGKVKDEIANAIKFIQQKADE